MFTSGMTIFTGAVALLSAFTMGGMAQSVANAHSMEILKPSPLGSTTSDGSLLVTMNYCTVLVHTQCQLSVMTSPPAPSSTTPAETTTPPAESVPTPATSSESSPPSTPTQASSTSGTDVTEQPSTAVPPPSSPADAPPVATTALTAGAAGMGVFPRAAWGVAVVAMAVLF